MYMTANLRRPSPSSKPRRPDRGGARPPLSRRVPRRPPRPRPCSPSSSPAGSTSRPSPPCWSRSGSRARPTDELIGAARALRAADARFRAARLSVRRQLRHRRRRLGHDQPLDRGRLRRGGGGPAGRQARQPLGHLALRLGRRARAARREARRPRRAVAPGAGRDRHLLPVRAGSTIPACAMPGRCAARSRCGRS